MRLQQPVDQRLQPVRFLDDDLRVLAQLVALTLAEFELEQLRRAANAAERILDLVREIADQLLVDRREVVDALLAVGAQMPLVLEQFEQHVVLRAFQKADDRMHMQRLVAGALEHGVEMRRVKTVSGDRGDGRDQFVRIREDVRPRHLRQLPARELQHRLRRRIRKRDAQRALFEHQHDRRQRLEARQQTGTDELRVVRQRLLVPFPCLDQILKNHLAVWPIGDGDKSGVSLCRCPCTSCVAASRIAQYAAHVANVRTV